MKCNLSKWKIRVILMFIQGYSLRYSHQIFVVRAFTFFFPSSTLCCISTSPLAPCLCVCVSSAKIEMNHCCAPFATLAKNCVEFGSQIVAIITEHRANGTALAREMRNGAASSNECKTSTKFNYIYAKFWANNLHSKKKKDRKKNETNAWKWNSIKI